MALHPPKTAMLRANSTAFLDLLRALAASLVLFGHASDIFGTGSRLPAGQIGVGVFFLLSGFLIFQSSYTRLQRPGPLFRALSDRQIRAHFYRLCSHPHPRRGAQRNGGSRPLGPGRHFHRPRRLHRQFADVAGLSIVPGDAQGHRTRRCYIRSYNSAEPFWTIPIEFWIYVVFGLGFFGLMAREDFQQFLPAITRACGVAGGDLERGGRRRQWPVPRMAGGRAGGVCLDWRLAPQPSQSANRPGGRRRCRDLPARDVA